MQDLPTFFRALADLCEQNGGKLPEEVLTLQPAAIKKPRKKKVGVTGNSLAQSIAQKVLYGNRRN